MSEPASPPAPPERRSQQLAALKYRDFTVYATARFLATLAWQMLNVTVGWQVWQLTKDPLSLGFIGLAQFTSFLVLVLPAGQLADRADRRLLLIGAYTAEAVAAAVLLWLTVSGEPRIWPVFAALVLFGSGRAFWMPAGQAITPNLVPVEAFPSAVAINGALFQTGVIVGPALGGLLLLLGPAVAYGTVLGLLILVVLLVTSIHPKRAAVIDAAFRMSDVLEGLRFVFRRRTVLGATAMLPIYANEVLGVSAAGFGALRAAPGVGAALVAAVLAFSPLQRHVGHWMFGGVALFGASTIVLGLSQSFWIAMAALFLLGAGDMISVFVRHLLVQLETPDAIRGRVSAVSSMFIGASNELGEFESGVAAEYLGVVRSVVLGGVATLGVVAIYLKLFPELRRMDRFPRM